MKYHPQQGLFKKIIFNTQLNINMPNLRTLNAPRIHGCALAINKKLLKIHT